SIVSLHAALPIFTDERVVEDLERERGELLVIARLARHFGAVERKPLDRRHFDRRRHVLDDGVQHRLHALVLECRTAHAQYDFVANRALAQAALHLGLRQRLALAILVQQLLVRLGTRLDELRTPLLALFAHVLRNLAIFELRSLRRGIPPDLFHPNE